MGFDPKAFAATLEAPEEFNPAAFAATLDAPAEFDPASFAASLGEPDPSKLEALDRTTADVLRRIPASIAENSAMAAQGVLYAAELLKPNFGDYTGPARDFLRGVQDRAKSDYGVDPSRDQDFVSKLISGAGSLVPIIASGQTLAPVTNAALMGESARQDAEAHGATEDQQKAAFAIGGATGLASEFLFGVPALLRSAKAAGADDAAVKTMAEKLIEQGFKNAGREAGQEAIEQLAQNFTANTLVGYDPGRKTTAGVAEAALIGGLVGGPTGVVVQAAAEADARVEQAQQMVDKAAEYVDAGLPQSAAAKIEVAQETVSAPVEEMTSTPEPTEAATPAEEVVEPSAPAEPAPVEQVEPDESAAVAAIAESENAQLDYTKEGKPAVAALRNGENFQITLKGENQQSTIYVPRAATEEHIRQAIQSKRAEMLAPSIDTPEKVDELIKSLGVSQTLTPVTSDQNQNQEAAQGQQEKELLTPTADAVPVTLKSLKKIGGRFQIVEKAQIMTREAAAVELERHENFDSVYKKLSDCLSRKSGGRK